MENTKNKWTTKHIKNKANIYHENEKIEIIKEKRRLEKEEIQANNEKKYSIIIKFVMDEVNKRPNHPFTKQELTNIILDVFSKSKYVSDRFNRQRTGNM